VSPSKLAGFVFAPVQVPDTDRTRHTDRDRGPLATDRCGQPTESDLASQRASPLAAKSKPSMVGRARGPAPSPLNACCEVRKGDSNEVEFVQTTDVAEDYDFGAQVTIEDIMAKQQRLERLLLERLPPKAAGA